jgi:hypothetical protein
VLFLVHRFLSPWWRRRQVPPKRRFLQEPHCVTTQKTPFFTVLILSTKCAIYSALVLPLIIHMYFTLYEQYYILIFFCVDKSLICTSAFQNSSCGARKILVCNVVTCFTNNASTSYIFQLDEVIFRPQYRSTIYETVTMSIRCSWKSPFVHNQIFKNS